MKLYINDIEIPINYNVATYNMNSGISLIGIMLKEELNKEDKFLLLNFILNGKVPRSKILNLDDYIDQLKDPSNLVYNGRYLETFRYKWKTYGLIDFNDITIEEMMDIEFYMNEGEHPFAMLPEICSILVRETKKKNTFNFLYNILQHRGYKVIPYDEKKCLNNIKIFNSFNFGIPFLWVTKFLDFRKNLYEQYFKDPEFKEEDFKVLDKYAFIKKEVNEEENKKNIKSFEQIWGIYDAIWSITESKKEFDYWLKKPIKELLKHLVYLKQKGLNGSRN